MIKPILMTIPALALLTCMGGSPAKAQPGCGDREDIVAQLLKNHGEVRRAVGLQQGRGVIEVYASESTGSWTILVTDTRGKSCLMAAGEAFQTETPRPIGTDS